MWYNCISVWQGDAAPIIDKEGKVRVLEVSQFANREQILGSVWPNITLSYDVREKFVLPDSQPNIGLMWYTIDSVSGKFKFWVGTIDSSG